MPTSNFFQLKGSVLDKIRTDFNVDKRDRLVPRCSHASITHLMGQMRSARVVCEFQRQYQPGGLGGFYYQDEGRYTVCSGLRHLPT